MLAQSRSSSGGFLSTLGRLPWMLFIVLFLLAAEYLHLPLEGTVGYAFITITIAVFFIEMLKSGDVSAFSFFIDQFWAVTTVVLASGLLTYLYFVEGKSPTFFHWLGFSIILADAIINPFNAFRTAVRNLDLH